MFSSKKDENIAKNNLMSDKTNQFVEGTVIEGEIQSTNDIRVDGVILGKVKSNAKIVVGEKGRIEGDIKCVNADISGNVKGRIEVKELLFLKGTSVIEGDIIANKLVVDNGARFNGSCNMGGVSQINNGEQRKASIEKEAI